jgi:fimbrial chaperone protein
VLSRFGIPVFVAPPKGAPDLRLQGVALDGGRVAISVENAGTVHTRLKSVLVRALDASGVELFTRELTGWYILAGGMRRYELALDPSTCQSASRIAVELVGEPRLAGSTDTAPGSCRP